MEVVTTTDLQPPFLHQNPIAADDNPSTTAKPPLFSSVDHLHRPHSRPQQRREFVFAKPHTYRLLTEMVEVEAQRLEVCFVKRKEVVFGWLVFLLFLSPVVGLRPLRDKTGSGGYEICLSTLI
ncbi:hypothetical protein KIW84_041762 [Lathyrus oleraceus]|uniref:Uncharacterized protein n=1 Tax=Pisum sativum TaxID=3888 RepID=A0A9D4XB10_PEA|nr:hypothetical protein KIW84_041762 [Pisum sativum]